MREKFMFKSILIIIILLISQNISYAGGSEEGITAADLMRQLAIICVILAIAGLLFIEFYYKRKISRSAYKWLLFLGLFMFPLIAMIGTFTTLMSETTTVASCASCHNMHPFVSDLQNEQSATLAARHFKNRWIPVNQCYHCHTTYGIHGTLESKRDGFRHWLLYVTNSWQEPITFKGSYPNSNCYACHSGTPKFDAVESHISLSAKLRDDEVSCSSCHGPVHPTPLERGTSPRLSSGQWQFEDPDHLQAVSTYLNEIASKQPSK
jgi:cytochrome c nitrite reductase small subunit